MKPFDLEAAKKGAPVRLKDGSSARIIAFDAEGDYPIVALVRDRNEGEVVMRFTNEGRNQMSTPDLCLDLTMVPVKHEGWVNIYRITVTLTEQSLTNGIIQYGSGQFFYKTKQLAEATGKINPHYITTVSIEWEE